MSAQWLSDAVFYEIYPQSFRDTNGDGIGDIPGIVEKLPYVKSLGCNAIWLNPCFDSPFKDAGYDVRDYYKVAPRYGTNDDLANLFREAHRQGIRILLDLVPGHTSEEHQWFLESAKVEKNEMSGRFIWTDSVWTRGDNMIAISGEFPRDGAYIINFFKCQPALNYGYSDRRQSWQQSIDSPDALATREAIKDIIRFWLDMGCDGFRVDMAASLVKNDPDSRANMKLWQEVRAFVEEEFPEAALISEWGEPDKSLAGGFHMDFLLHFGPSHYNDLFRCEEPFFSSRGKGDISQFVETYKRNYEKTGGKGLICIPSGNHDMARLTHYLHGDELKIVFAFLLSMPGAPFIYYGDEIGMRYLPGLVSVEGGFERTGARTPMQWDSTVNAGFSAAPRDKLYITMDESKDRPTVKAQLEDENSLLHEIRRLTGIRQAHEALQSNGKITFLYAEEKAYPLAYLRSGETEDILVIINPADRQVSFPCDYIPTGTAYHFGKEAAFDGKTAVVAPCSAGFYCVARA